jgi:hypothetical protein
VNLPEAFIHVQISTLDTQFEFIQTLDYEVGEHAVDLAEIVRGELPGYFRGKRHVLRITKESTIAP